MEQSVNNDVDVNSNQSGIKEEYHKNKIKNIKNEKKMSTNMSKNISDEKNDAIKDKNIKEQSNSFKSSLADISSSSLRSLELDSVEIKYPDSFYQLLDDLIEKYHRHSYTEGII